MSAVVVNSAIDNSIGKCLLERNREKLRKSMSSDLDLFKLIVRWMIDDGSFSWISLSFVFE